MVFFRLGKLDRGGKEEKGQAELSPEREQRKGTEAESVASSVGSASAPQDAKEGKPEKPKKKSKDTDGPASSSQCANESRASSGVPARAQAGLSVNDFISKTKNQQRQGLKPSGPELIAYARYLGIDPVADHDLLWIAVEALEAPLPSDWTEHFDSNDRVFYYNATMRVSSWTHPLEHIYRETYKTIVNFRNANMAPSERSERLHQLQHEVKQMEHDVHKEIAQWTEHTDEQGNRFYFNREERQSTWTDPRPAKCQILYLRMKMLRLLQSSTGGTPGFADSKVDGLSRFAPLASSDFDDPAFKRPKVGGGRGSETSSRDVSRDVSVTRSPRPLPLGADGGWPVNHCTSDGEGGNGMQDGAGGRSIPSSPSSARDSETEDERSKKKKKKKKKKKQSRRERDQGPPATPPPRPGGAQNLRNSQSEPSVGGKPLPAGVDERGGGGGLGGMQNSPSGVNSLAHAPFDHAEGLSTHGRARVKASIRLEPIAPPQVGGGGSSMPSAGEPSADRLAKGVRNSASVPALQP